MGTAEGLRDIEGVRYLISCKLCIQAEFTKLRAVLKKLSSPLQDNGSAINYKLAISWIKKWQPLVTSGHHLVDMVAE